MNPIIFSAWLFALAAPSDTPWDYSMVGDLDNTHLSCSGSAQVSSTNESGHLQCVSWHLSATKCAGTRSVDWLHQFTNDGEICQSPDAWNLKKQLPGRGYCEPEVVVKDDKPVSFSLDCTWECRSADNPCSGSATYKFSQASVKK